MYELYLNGSKVKQINYIGEHDYTPTGSNVPLITQSNITTYTALGQKVCIMVTNTQMQKL